MHDGRSSTIKPLTARSVVLSVLLGYHPPELPVSALVRVGALFDIAERTTRVALSRMVADGDLTSAGGRYRLTDRLVRRQLRQEEAASPSSRPWTGDWRMAVITSAARTQADRLALRHSMADLRFAELREGVWLRPSNLVDEPDGVVAQQCTFFSCHHPRPAELSGRLWDLENWGALAQELYQRLAAPRGLKADFLLIAEAVRHLRADPYLPPELLPPQWPGPRLRARYVGFRDDFALRLRAYSEDPVASRKLEPR